MCEGKVQLMPPIFTCPNCGKEQKIPRHNREEECECGLRWMATGNMIKIFTVTEE